MPWLPLRLRHVPLPVPRATPFLQLKKWRRTRHAGNLGTEVSREEPHTPKPLAKTLYIEYLRLWL